MPRPAADLLPSPAPASRPPHDFGRIYTINRMAGTAIYNISRWAFAGVSPRFNIVTSTLMGVRLGRSLALPSVLHDCCSGCDGVTRRWLPFLQSCFIMLIPSSAFS